MGTIDKIKNVDGGYRAAGFSEDVGERQSILVGVAIATAPTNRRGPPEAASAFESAAPGIVGFWAKYHTQMSHTALGDVQWKEDLCTQ
jgi:hypothetical protein